MWPFTKRRVSGIEKLQDVLKAVMATESGDGLDAATFTGGRSLQHESLGTKKRCKAHDKLKSALTEVHKGDDEDEEDEPPLGTGERFARLRDKLKKRGVKDPDALAAAIGRRKYGKRGMAALAHKGGGA